MRSHGMTTYQVRDRLHTGRMARVSADGIVGTVCIGDRAVAHAIAECLSVDVAAIAMADFLRNTDAFTWSMESDPRLQVDHRLPRLT